MNENKNAPIEEQLSITQDELYCIARHMQSFYKAKQEMIDNNRYTELNPCDKCKFVKENSKPCNVSRCGDYASSASIFKKLSKITGVQTSCRCIGQATNVLSYHLDRS